MVRVMHGAALVLPNSPNSGIRHAAKNVPHVFIMPSSEVGLKP